MGPGEAPLSIEPRAASLVPSLRGRRVIVGVPGLGWRGDLRADDPVVHGSRGYVPVLTEQDYYRSETEQLEVFAPLVPIDRVWVELLAQPPGHRRDVAPPGHRRDVAPPALDAPPRREPMPVRLAQIVTGRRVIQVVADGHVRDLRAVTEVHRNIDGGECVRVCGEAEWYRWALAGTTPSTVEIPADRLWLE